MQDPNVVSPLEYQPVRVSGDWLPDDFAVDAYWNGVRWNGFLVPLFTLASALQLCESMPTLEFAASDSSFLLRDEYGATFIHGRLYIIGMESLLLYAIGDGWCWHLVESVSAKA